METEFKLVGPSEPVARKSMAGDAKAKQGVLFSGMNCLPGQLDLFETDGAEVAPRKAAISMAILEDTDQTRVTQVSVVESGTGAVLYKTKATEKRRGMAQWDRSEIYAARRRVTAFSVANSIELTEKDQ